MKEVKWSQARREFQRGATYTALAEKYGVSVSTVSRRARLEGWGKRGQSPGSGCTIAQVSERLLEAAEAALLCDDGTMSIRDMKELAALVRELTALREAEARGGECGAVRVVLEGETRRWGS